MKNIIKKGLSFSCMMAASLFAFSSCSDWTEVEAVDVVTPQIDEQLKADYIENLKQYKNSDHKMVIVTFDNKTERPANQSEHLTVLPDSIDVISMMNPTAINDVMTEEIKRVREKGTRVIFDVNYAPIELEWNQMVKEDTEGKLTEEDALAHIAKRAAEQLAVCDELGYDGVTFTYMGKSEVSMKEPEKARYAARQNSFMKVVSEWRSAHADLFCAFIGNPQYLVEAQGDLLSKCDYIILPTDAAKDMDELTVKAFAAMEKPFCPKDRFIVAAQTVRPDDDKQIYGYFGTFDAEGNRMRSIYGSAVWCAEPSEHFTRAGLMICNAHFDYFDSTLVYGNIREAVNIMNPSSKN